mgnify:CR=1 FL=1
MGKVIYILVFFCLINLSCNNTDKVVNYKNVDKKEVKIYNGDSIGNLTESELNGCYLYKLFPNGDTNFIYLFKDNKATSVIAWDTNGVKTLENKIGVWKNYENNILTFEIFLNGKEEDYIVVSYFPSGKKLLQLTYVNYKLVEIIKFNENGDTIHYERPKQIKKSKKEKN